MTFDSSTNRKLKRRFAFIFIPIVFAVIGLLIMRLAFRPLNNNFQDYLGLITANSAPNFTQQLKSSYKGTSKNPSKIKNSTVTIPSYNEQYARLKCEELGIDAPLYWGDSELALRYGTGTYSGSSLPGYGSVVLVAGHNSTFFKPLKDVKTGQIFKVKTNYGNYTYEVSKIQLHEFNDTSAVDFSSDKEQLVLYTCYPFKPMSAVRTKRLFVYCKKVSGPVVVDMEEDF